MKNILSIYKNDLKKIGTNMVAFIVIIGISILPALYAWFNIASNWDPYANTGNIMVAVVNLDEGAEISKIKLNVGDQVVENLKGNTQMGWQFVSKAEAEEGIKTGKYYASVLIPENFSADLTSVLSGELRRPQITYTLNEKMNAIAPKITDKGAEAIKNEVNQSYIDTVTKTLVETLTLTAGTADDKYGKIKDNLKTGVGDLIDDIEAVEGSIDLVVTTIDASNVLIDDAKDGLPNVSALLGGAGTITSDAKDTINGAGDAAGQISGGAQNIIGSIDSIYDGISPDLDEAFKMVGNDSESAANRLKNTAQINTRIINLENDLRSFFTMVNDDHGTDTSNIVSKIDASIAEQNAIIDKINSVSDNISKTGKVPQNAKSELDKLVSEGKQGIAELSEELSSNPIGSVYDEISPDLDEAFEMIGNDSEAAANKFKKTAQINSKILNVESSMRGFFSMMNDNIGINTSSIVGKLDANIAKQNAIIDKINSIADTVTKTGKAPKNAKSELDQLIADGRQGITEISNELSSNSIGSFYEEISPEIDEALETVGNDFSAAAERFTKIAQVNSRIISLENDLRSFLNVIDDKLGVDTSRIIGDIDSSIAEQNAIIDKLGSIADAVSKTGKVPQNAKSELDSMIASGRQGIVDISSEFSTNIKPSVDKVIKDVFKGLENVTGMMNQVDGDVPDIETALDSGKDSLEALKTSLVGINKSLDNGKDRLNTVLEKIDTIQDENTLVNFINSLSYAPDELGEFMSSPVKVQTVKVYPVANYGSAMAPFYTVLAIWVGSIVLIAILKTELGSKDIKRLGGNVRPIEAYFGRYQIYLTAALIQGLIIALGDLYFLKIQCTNHVLFILTVLLTSFVFSLFVYSLTVTFSVIGKAIAVIILVLQVAGSGGTYPPEVLPEFFQKLLPYLPFKYAVNAIRETVAGVYTKDYVNDLLMLMIYVAVALFIGIILRKPFLKIMNYFNKRLEETDLMV